jgi:hypothetical protein
VKAECKLRFILFKELLLVRLEMFACKYCMEESSGQKLVVSLGKRHVDYLLNRSGGEVAAIARRIESLVDTRSVLLFIIIIIIYLFKLQMGFDPVAVILQ